LTPAVKRGLAKYKASPKGKAAEVAYRARRKQRLGDKVSVYARRHHLKKKFGLTPEQFMQMYDNQEGLCAICSTLMLVSEGGRSGRQPRHAVLDHDHATGKVRGLLCRRCNTGIGMLRDDPRIVLNAASYLRDAA
jgi:hypothetical protein